jgi:3-oxoacyl-[acyl-carrier protein] reductase
MDLGLQGKVALVTGSSKGIGLAVATRLATEGCKVTLTARNPQELAAARQGIEAEGGTVHAVPGDACNPVDVERVVTETEARFGALHILVNNVGGIGRFATFDELEDREWSALFELNLLSAVRFTRAALPHLRRSRWGRIINIASESGSQPDAEMPHYSVTKGALLTLTKSLSKALAGYGILVNAVSPAFIWTPLVQGMMVAAARKQGGTVEEATAAFLAGHRPHIELRRPGREDEIAAVVAFLASTAASFVNGANWRVDGGSVASI